MSTGALRCDATREYEVVAFLQYTALQSYPSLWKLSTKVGGPACAGGPVRLIGNAAAILRAHLPACFALHGSSRHHWQDGILGCDAALVRRRKIVGPHRVRPRALYSAHLWLSRSLLRVDGWSITCDSNCLSPGRLPRPLRGAGRYLPARSCPITAIEVSLLTKGRVLLSLFWLSTLPKSR